jgi:hypothetical protein
LKRNPKKTRTGKFKKVGNHQSNSRLAGEGDRTVDKKCVMSDECHLVWGDTCGYVWGKTKERIEVAMTNERERQIILWSFRL